MLCRLHSGNLNNNNNLTIGIKPLIITENYVLFKYIYLWHDFLSVLLYVHAFTFQGDDLACGVHDGTVGRDRSPDWISGVRHVHDHHLVLLAHLLPDADELVRLHGQIAEPNIGWVHAQVLQLEILIKPQ